MLKPEVKVLNYILNTILKCTILFCQFLPFKIFFLFIRKYSKQVYLFVIICCYYISKVLGFWLKGK